MAPGRVAQFLGEGPRGVGRALPAPGGAFYGLAQPAHAAAGRIPASSSSTWCLQRCNSLQITAGTCMEETPGAAVQIQHTA